MNGIFKPNLGTYLSIGYLGLLLLEFFLMFLSAKYEEGMLILILMFGLVYSTMPWSFIFGKAVESSLSVSRAKGYDFLLLIILFTFLNMILIHLCGYLGGRLYRRFIKKPLN